MPRMRRSNGSSFVGHLTETRSLSMCPSLLEWLGDPRRCAVLFLRRLRSVCESVSTRGSGCRRDWHPIVFLRCLGRHGEATAFRSAEKPALRSTVLILISHAVMSSSKVEVSSEPGGLTAALRAKLRSYSHRYPSGSAKAAWPGFANPCVRALACRHRTSDIQHKDKR